MKAVFKKYWQLMIKIMQLFRRRRTSQTRSGSGLPSTATDPASSAINEPLNQPASTSSATLHQSCSTLPLSNFLEIIITGELRWLIRDGSPSDAELAEAWTAILEEYGTHVKTEKSDSVFACWKRIKKLQADIQFIEKSVMVLKHQYDEEIAEWLSSKGFGQVEYSTDREKYLRSLYGIETGSKTLIVLLNQTEAEYQTLTAGQAEDTSTPEEKRMRYEKEIALLGKFQGFRIVKEKITVLEYCAILNNYIEESNRLKKQMESNGRK